MEGFKELINLLQNNLFLRSYFKAVLYRNQFNDSEVILTLELNYQSKRKQWPN